MCTAEYAVDLKHVSKTYTLKKTTVYGGTTKSGEKKVLEDVTFSIKKGEVIGLIGRNGCGKSTLLKILSGILPQDSGEVKVNGKVTSILELGMGFDPEMSGHENIRYRCTMYGFSNSDIDSFMEDIITFSELGEQIDAPFKTYSSGMAAKLSFSLLTHVNCDIMIIDEALSVGDSSFKSKCSLVFDKLRNENKTVIIASHDLQTIQELCDRVCWIESGAVKEIGDVNSVCHHYESSISSSIEILELLSSNGDSTAQNRLGQMYEEGIHISRDLNKAKLYYNKSAEMGNADAMYNYANLLFKEGEKDKAKILLEQSAKKGNIAAISQIYGIEDVTDVALCLKKMADNNNTRAMYVLADALLSKTIQIQNFGTPAEYFSLASELNDTNATFRLGLMYRDGAGVQKDPQYGIELIKKAAKNGNGRARAELANTYRRGIGIERDMQRCVECYTDMAKYGDTNAMLQIGTILRDGAGVPKNEKESQKWLTMFANSEKYNLYYQVADILICDSKTDADLQQAYKWFEYAAKGGHILAMYRVGILSRDGVGTAPNAQIAANWFEQAANRYHIPSIIEISNMYLRGNGVPRDLEKARNYLQMAANVGNNVAHYILGTLYRDKIGVEKDIQKAEYHFTRSSESGYAPAISALSRLHHEVK